MKKETGRNSCKIMMLVMMLAGMLSLMAGMVMAEDGTQVMVTITNGEVVLAQKPVTVTDLDADGSITICDALTAAHAQYFPDGAAGFQAANGDYGLYITKLWGVENGGSYGYYVNHVMSMGLGDTVKNGDYLAAYVYQDLTAYSDAYCYFDKDSLTGKTDETFSSVLKANGFDASWNVVSSPLAGAVITVNGAESGVVTDENGAFSLNLPEAGTYVISAKKDGMVLVPPVLLVTAEQAAQEPAEPTPSEKPAEAETPEKAPETGDSLPIGILFVLAVSAIAVYELAERLANRRG